MKTKKVELIMQPPEIHWVGDGFRVHNFIPGGFHLEMERMNPFILLDYNSKYYFPPSDKPKGVGVHPHRGLGNLQAEMGPPGNPHAVRILPHRMREIRPIQDRDSHEHIQALLGRRLAPL